MARLRNTEPEVAVQAAQALFWEHGYAGLGTRQIEEETGLTRFTLQTSYGGKKQLFLQAVDAYLDNIESHFLPDASNGSLQELATWFETRADPAFMPGIGCHGCLMLNSVIEFHGEDSDINQRAERFFSMVRGRFRSLLEAAKSNGVLSSNLDTGAMAEILLGISLSMNVVIRAAGNNSAGQALATATANMIREWE